MFSLVRGALFRTSPETAHELALEGLRMAYATGASRFFYRTEGRPVRVMGLEFPNPVGLAAGMDKNGDYIDALGALGFGFIEVGTVTPRPQPGNPKPRVFRIEQAQALINRLGFNNKGVDHLVARANTRRWPGVLGINIGKNFDTPIERAVDDYLYGLDRVYACADYVTVNISSPNTKNLRELQGEAALAELLGRLDERREALAERHARRVPLVVKVAPDLDDEDIPGMAKVIARQNFDGVIATNTTIARDAVAGLPHADETGGLSGAPLLERADEVLARFRDELPRGIALIGTGGITRGEDAARKLRLGADLVQFYTGFVYRGPELVAECARAAARVERAA